MLFTFSNHLNADLRSFHLPPFLAWNCWDLPKRTPAEIRFVLGFRPLDSWPERGSKEDAAWAVGVGAGCLVWAVLTFVMSKWVVDKQLKWQANEQQGESWAPTSSFLADGFKVVFYVYSYLGWCSNLTIVNILWHCLNWMMCYVVDDILPTYYCICSISHEIRIRNQPAEGNVTYEFCMNTWTNKKGVHVLTLIKTIPMLYTHAHVFLLNTTKKTCALWKSARIFFRGWKTVDQPPMWLNSKLLPRNAQSWHMCMTHVMSRSNLQNTKAQKPGLIERVSFEGNKQIEEMKLKEC